MNIAPLMSRLIVDLKSRRTLIVRLVRSLLKCPRSPDSAHNWGRINGICLTLPHEIISYNELQLQLSQERSIRMELERRIREDEERRVREELVKHLLLCLMFRKLIAG